MTIILSLLLSLAAVANEKNLLEKTYARDNTFCQIGGKRVEIMIRGDHRHTEPVERTWGEHVVMRLSTGKTILLPVNKESGLYRLFPGNPSACSKAMGAMIGKRFALLIQKMNRPHKSQLVIQYIDPMTLEVLESPQTQLLADAAVSSEGAILLRTHPPYRQDIEMGKIVINGRNYLYQDHVFPMWMKLDSAGLSVDPKKTYEEFGYRQFFKDQTDFLNLAGWQETEKAFPELKFYVAINHSAKSKCVLLLREKKKISGDEGWICQ